jgi:glycosyltransferase involved in cell wall biosynthesis
MQIKWYVSELHACGHIRGEAMAREVNSRLANVNVDVKSCIVMSDFPKTNIMVFQRSHQDAYLEKMMIAKKHRIKTIYEVDDDMFRMPKEFEKPYEFYSDPKVRQCMLDFMDNADAITCSTEELAKVIQEKCPKKNIYIIENYLDVVAWDRAYTDKQAEKDKGKIHIGWMASGSHVIDVPVIEEALELLMEKYDDVVLHFIGWIGFNNINMERFKNRIIVDDWISIGQLPSAMASFDINICPLSDNPFNRCKSHLKYLQGSALGIPSICSPLPPYTSVLEDGVDGLFATTPASWLACLSELVENENLRIDMGKKARAKLLDKYDMSTNYIHWVNAFERIKRG